MPTASVTQKGPINLAVSFHDKPGANFRCSVDSHAYPPTTTSAGLPRWLACFAMVRAARKMVPRTNYTVDYIAATHSATDYTGQSVTLHTACSNGNTGSCPNNTYAGV